MMRIKRGGQGEPPLADRRLYLRDCNFRLGNHIFR